MHIIARVKPASASTSVTVLPDGSLEVRIRERPEKGKANKATLEAIARHFKLAPSRISIAAGHSSRTKIVVIR